MLIRPDRPSPDPFPEPKIAVGDARPKKDKKAKSTSLARVVRRVTRGMVQHVKAMDAIALNLQGNVGVRERIHAIEWLADRGYGRAVDTTVMVAAEANAMSEAMDLSSDQLKQLVAQLRVKPAAKRDQKGDEPIAPLLNPSDELRKTPA